MPGRTTKPWFPKFTIEHKHSSCREAREFRKAMEDVLVRPSVQKVAILLDDLDCTF